ncbi:DUF4097 family beta strand repeat-containing protein [Georgenia yuyongxinii]|uniref:DUF4097 domain-containing protein n=1 Tax=Georgenia yuyongxinii TaxID=2589797 RepID=A0A552WX22_9MICO|nr:DUF4097 family beta strand repeat-containing protein [Georgenia yuyongxinii]TRW47324.1 DUF4097 domain-containing protein [Georgenia yuyongxinii]
MHYTFETPGPTELYVELGAGRLTVRADDGATATTVDVEGTEAAQVTVEQRGPQVVLLAPRRWFDVFGSFHDLTVDVTVPTASTLVTRLGSADMVATGRFGAARLRTGSGDLRVDELTRHAVVETGSGDVEITAALSDLRVRSGSGDVRVGRCGGSVGISTGSGDVALGTTEGDVMAKSGSGELNVADARTSLRLTTASGDVHVAALHAGQVRAKAVSGDVRVGVTPGVPVWTDVNSISGKVVSTLQGAGRPGPGQEHIEIHASTVSGGVYLEQLT